MKEIGFLRKDYERNADLDRAIDNVEKIAKKLQEADEEFLAIDIDKTKLIEKADEETSKLEDTFDKYLTKLERYAQTLGYILLEYMETFHADTVLYSLMLHILDKDGGEAAIGFSSDHGVTDSHYEEDPIDPDSDYREEP